VPTVSELEQYLQSPERRSEEADIAAVEKIAVDVVKVFVSSFDSSEAAWPYKLVNGGERKRSKQFSFSTMAMICFALSIVVERIQASVLAPTLGSLPSDSFPGVAGHKIELERHIDAAVAEFCRQSDRINDAHVEERVSAGEMPELGSWPTPLTDSTTFGWDDPFTFTWLAEVLRCGAQSGLEPFRNRVSERGWKIVESLGNPAGAILRVKPDEEVPHAFPLLRLLHLGESLAQTQGIALEDRINLTAVRNDLFERVHQRLSESEIADSAFDAADLVFSLEGWILSSSFEPDAAVIGRAFDVLAESQERTPYWRPLRPFKATSQGLVLLPQSVEIANSLLRICAATKPGGRDYFSDHVKLLERYASWILSRVFRGALTDRTPFAGWESEHTFGQNQIHLWETSQVLIFLYHYMAMLRQHMAGKLMRLAGFAAEDPGTKGGLAVWGEKKAGKEGYGEPFNLGRQGSQYRFYEEIESSFVAPRFGGGGDPLYSMLLYGPPGTGKSTIAKSLSKALGMRMIKVTPSDFIAGGGEAVEARAKAIFEVLGAQRDLVVLFDEIDQLLLDRESDLYNQQQDLFKLLTPGMLTKLNELSDQKSVVFVIATNYYERIDRAIKRVGRIDARYLVLPPDMGKRAQHLGSKLKGRWSEIDTDQQEAIARETVFFTYSELDELASRALARSAKDNRLFVDIVRERIKESPPLATIKSYSARLEEEDPEKKPLEEVALLADLYLEAFRKLPAEPEGIREAIREALDEEKVRDEEIGLRLREALGTG